MNVRNQVKTKEGTKMNNQRTIPIDLPRKSEVDTASTNKSGVPATAQDKELALKVRELNRLLADEYTLFTKTLNYHWNITGPRFKSVHEFLETQYKDLLEMIDDVAERVREVGGYAIGTLEEIKGASTLPEQPKSYPQTSEMISNLRSDHMQIQKKIKSILSLLDERWDDPGSEDFLTSLLKKHEEMTWMLTSHLES